MCHFAYFSSVEACLPENIVLKSIQCNPNVPKVSFLIKDVWIEKLLVVAFNLATPGHKEPPGMCSLWHIACPSAIQSQTRGGIPIQSCWGYTPIQSWWQSTPIHSWQGVSQPGQDRGGTPCLDWIGYYPIGTGWDYPLLGLDGDTPHGSSGSIVGWRWGNPPVDRQTFPSINITFSSYVVGNKVSVVTQTQLQRLGVQRVSVVVTSLMI